MKLKIQFTSVPLLSKILILLFFITLPLFGFYLGVHLSQLKTQPKFQLLTMNAQWSGDEKLLNENTFQIKYPSSYFVTSKEMFTYFRTQGGGGFPDLVLTKGEQFTNPYTTEDHAIADLYQGQKDCILIFRYQPTEMPGIGNQEQSINGSTVLSVEQDKIGKFQAVVRKVKDQVNYYDAYLFVTPEHNYYFRTCNLKNKQDLITVLQFFDTR